MSHQGLYLCAISLIRKLLVAWGHKLLGGCNLRSIGQVFAIRIASLITPKFVVAIKITAYNVLVVYYRKLANVQDGIWGWYTFVMHVLWILMVDHSVWAPLAEVATSENLIELRTSLRLLET